MIPRLCLLLRIGHGIGHNSSAIEPKNTALAMVAIVAQEYMPIAELFDKVRPALFFQCN